MGEMKIYSNDLGHEKALICHSRKMGHANHTGVITSPPPPAGWRNEVLDCNVLFILKACIFLEVQGFKKTVVAGAWRIS